MRVRSLIAAVDNDGIDDSHSTAHSAMARTRRRHNVTLREDPTKGTAAGRRGRRVRFRHQVPRTTADAHAPIAGKTPRDGDGHAATTHRWREGTRVRTLTAAINNDSGNVSRSTAHSVMDHA